MTRRRITQADLAELRKHAPQIEANPVGIITRQIVDPASEPPVRTAMHDALIAAAMADFQSDGRLRRLILDGVDGYEIEPFGSMRAHG